MKRCLEISKMGLPAALPNPSVGAVIVHNDRIIGEGFTAAYGGSHAEVNAINAVKDKSLLAYATMYVSLEPCSHFGKTPPCCDLLIKYKIPTVVIGIIDSNNKVSGEGIKRIKASGANVIVGILEKECFESNERFFTYHEKKRPFIILKWAESHDGYIAPEFKKIQQPVWISNIYSRQLVHKWRSEEQAILVGTNTVIADNPKLDTRDWAGKNPIRIVLDQKNRISQASQVFDNQIKTIVLTSRKLSSEKENIIFESINFEQNLSEQIGTILFQHGIQSVIIEGGQKTLQTFIDANLWDEARVFKSNVVLKSGTKAPILPKKAGAVTSVYSDQLKIIKNHD